MAALQQKFRAVLRQGFQRGQGRTKPLQTDQSATILKQQVLMAGQIDQFLFQVDIGQGHIARVRAFRQLGS